MPQTQAYPVHPVKRKRQVKIVICIHMVFFLRLSDVITIPRTSETTKGKEGEANHRSDQTRQGD